MKKTQRIVVVGCSGTGALAAMTLKKLDPGLEVTVLREPDEPGLLTRCATPYICCGHVMVEPSYKDDALFTDAGIRLVDEEAVELDREKKRVVTAGGTAHPYDVLVLATGAEPVMPPLPGMDLDGVFGLRKSGDAVRILRWMNERRVRSAAVIGAGPVGVEIAYLATQRGVHVHVIEQLDHVLPKALDADMSHGLEACMRERGVGLHLGQRVEALEGRGAVRSAALSSGETLEAGMVLVSVGVRPRSGLAEKAGLAMGERALRVDARLRTSDPDIYAGGDLTEHPHWVTGRPCSGPLRPNAVIAGRVIARNILGAGIEYPGLINGFATKFFEKAVAGTGLTEAQAEDEGLDVLCATQASTSQHSMMPGRKPYALKLVFDRTTGAVVGGQIVSDDDGPVKHIDVITAAMRGRLTALDLATLRCAGQPELSPDPGKEPIALAAGQVLGELG